MQTILNQIQKGLKSKHYHLSLFTALSLPYICGALESPNGLATEKKYIKWFDDNIARKYKKNFSGTDCFKFWASLLHQGTSRHPKSKYSKIFFFTPNQKNKHNKIADDTLHIDLIVFCNDIDLEVKKWLKKIEKTPLYKANDARFGKNYSTVKF